MTTPEETGQEQSAAPRREHLLGDNRVSLLHDGAACFPQMLADIASAEREVLLEMYWFGSDKTGQRFAEALLAASARGVRVCVIYDAVGSLEADPEMFARMREGGCEVIECNPIAPWRHRFRLESLNYRDHRKILVVDQRIAITGGINIGDPWASEEDGGGNWRDDMVRVEGPTARELRAVFLRTWQRLGGSGERLDPPLPRSAFASGPIRVLTGDFFGERREIRRVYLTQIKRARGYVFITNSYFVPDRAVRRALVRAVRRGVDVRVLLPAKSDVKVVQYASRRLYGYLLAHGVRIYEYHRSVLHSKTAIIDGRWCTVGTYNLDYRSWRFNLEVNVGIEDAQVATSLRKRFEADLEHAVVIEQKTWNFRPLAERFFEWFFYLFHKLL